MVDKDGHSYFASLEIKNVTVEDAGKYRVTAKNELGESNATISLNFDSKFFYFIYYLFDRVTFHPYPTLYVASNYHFVYISHFFDANHFHVL